MSEKHNNPPGEQPPEISSPEARRARVAQLKAEHKQLNQQWSGLISESTVLFGTRLKSLDEIEQQQQRLEVLTAQMNQIHESQNAVEEELFLLALKEESLS